MHAATKLARKAHLLIDFLAVVEEGGIRGAADRIHLSQSALTRRIQELEEGLGVALFERTAKGMALTTSGEILLRHARNVSQSFEYAVGEIGDLIAGATGELRIAAGTAWTPALVPDAIARLRQQLPTIQVSLLTRVGGAVQKLAEGHLDVLVGAAPTMHREVLEYEPLVEIVQRVFARADHPLHGLMSLDVQHLADYPWLWLGETLTMQSPLEQHFVERGVDVPQFAIKTSSVHIALRLAQGGDYLVLLPSTLTHLAADSGLAALQIDQPLPMRYSAGLVYRAGTARLRAFSAFRQCLAKGIADLQGHTL